MNRQLATKDTVLSTGDLLQRSETEDGSSYLTCRIEAGISGRETSWKVDGIIEVLVRSIVVHIPISD